MTARATYQIYIDWDNDGGLFAGNFEGSFDGWIAEGTLPPAIDLTGAFAHISDQSLQIAWTAYTPVGAGDTGTEIKFGTAGRGFDQGRFGGGADTDALPPKVAKEFVNFIIGRQYELTAWVYVPTGGEHVRIGVQGLSTSSASTALDAWQMLTCQFIATGTSHVLEFTANTATIGGELTYVDEIMVTGPGEDVSQRVLGLRKALDISYGRDQGRSLSLVAPGETSLELNNISRDYSPDNPGSVIAGFLGSGKQVLIKATYNGSTHVMFAGYINDYQITPDKNSRSVTISCQDILSRLSATISTPVYEVLRTGDGVHRILDAIGWPDDKRDIDPGATVMSYWWAEAKTGLEALAEIMQSEGLPSFAFVDSGNNFVFRDRHHRLLSPASITSQATFVDVGTEPQFSPPMTYDIGWKDIINSISASIDQRAVGDVANVFESTDVIALRAGESRVLVVQGSDPFIEALTPVAGIDYTLLYGAVDIVLSRDSGQSVELTITASAESAVSSLCLRARPVAVARTYKVVATDPVSVTENGVKSHEGDMPWANLNDANAVSAIILGQRGQRLPIVSITVKNANATRLTQILTRDLSDRVRIVETETFTDHDFYIEKVDHDIKDIGASHDVTFSCERVRTQVSPVFTFDSASQGFDAGLFGLDGIDDPETVFILDASALDTGLLGT